MSSSESRYRKSLEELERVASKFWPRELSQIEAQKSIIPLLLETQDNFISIIGTGAPTLDRFFSIVEAAEMPANLFVKHMVILADFGGEMLQRVSGEFEKLFPKGELFFEWKGKSHIYQFKALPERKFSNATLRIDGRELLRDHPLDDLQKDAIALLLFGNSHAAVNPEAGDALAKCELGEYLGKPNELGQFVKQRYIWVSRITGGATSNTLGQIAQAFVADYLKANIKLPHFEMKAGGRLPDVSHTDAGTGLFTAFDLIASNGVRYVAVEVSFQVTTNSVIERKSGQARSRYEQVEQAGHKIAYVLDGAGNFRRSSALRTICEYSDCTVAFSRSELDILCQFISEFLQQED
ncbi:MAG: restriction endonuclease [Anaerolineae bacterium]